MIACGLWVCWQEFFSDNHIGCTSVLRPMVLNAHELLWFPQTHSANHHNKANIV